MAASHGMSVGSIVRLCNICDRPEINNLMGTISSRNGAITDHWHVLMLEGEFVGKLLSITETNLLRCDEPCVLNPIPAGLNEDVVDDDLEKMGYATTSSYEELSDDDVLSSHDHSDAELSSELSLNDDPDSYSDICSDSHEDLPRQEIEKVIDESCGTIRSCNLACPVKRKERIFECPMCHDIPIIPYKLLCACRKTFCLPCYNKSSLDRQCSVCRERCTRGPTVDDEKLIMSDAEQFICSNCSWKGVGPRALKAHEANCAQGVVDLQAAYVKITEQDRAIEEGVKACNELASKLCKAQTKCKDLVKRLKRFHPPEKKTGGNRKQDRHYVRKLQDSA